MADYHNIGILAADKLRSVFNQKPNPSIRIDWVSMLYRMLNTMFTDFHIIIGDVSY
ncbi:hypothetical protein SKB0120_00490 [Moraxella osloensis]